MAQNKTVAHYEDGKLFKGIANTFSPNKNTFHMILFSVTRDSKPVELVIDGLKGLFFV